MKMTLPRRALGLLFAVTLSPVLCFARPVHLAASRQSVVHNRSPHVQSHESILHHS